MIKNNHNVQVPFKKKCLDDRWHVHKTEKIYIKKERFSVDKVKRLVIIALLSDDYLMDTLVLKEGNAISVAYGLSYRGLCDLDYSIPEDFNILKDVESRMEKLIKETFVQEDLHVFGFQFKKRPSVMSIA